MPSSSLPAASLSALFSFPASQLGRSVYNPLIYLILSSIAWAVFGARSRFLPALREATGPGDSILADELADAVVLGVADVDRAIGSDDGAVRTAETGSGGRTAVTLGAFTPAGDRLDDAARGIDAADRVVLGVDDQDVAAGVEGEFLGRVEDCIPRRAAVAAVAAGTGAGDGIDHPGAGIDRAQRAAL